MFHQFPCVIETSCNTRDPIPTHITEKDWILHTVYCCRVWILCLNKDKGADSLQAVLCNNEYGVWCYLIWLSLQPGFHTMSLFLLTKSKEWCQFMRLAPELVQHAINHC